MKHAPCHRVRSSELVAVSTGERVEWLIGPSRLRVHDHVRNSRQLSLDRFDYSVGHAVRGYDIEVWRHLYVQVDEHVPGRPTGANLVRSRHTRHLQHNRLYRICLECCRVRQVAQILPQNLR